MFVDHHTNCVFLHYLVKFIFQVSVLSTVCFLLKFAAECLDL